MTTALKEHQHGTAQSYTYMREYVGHIRDLAKLLCHTTNVPFVRPNINASYIIRHGRAGKRE